MSWFENYLWLSLLITIFLIILGYGWLLYLDIANMQPLPYGDLSNINLSNQYPQNSRNTRKILSFLGSGILE